MSLFTAALTLFLIMDPLGNIPVFVSILKDYDSKRQRMIIIREHLISLFLLVMVLLVGEKFTAIMGFHQESISIGGGIVLFLIAIKMIFPTPSGSDGDKVDEEPFIVPLAVPLIAGPSAVATLLLFVSSHQQGFFHWLLVVLLAWTSSLAILLFAPLFLKLLKRRVLIAIEKVMGMVLIVMSVQMFFEGLLKYMARMPH